MKKVEKNLITDLDKLIEKYATSPKTWKNYKKLLTEYCRIDEKFKNLYLKGIPSCSVMVNKSSYYHLIKNNFEDKLFNTPNKLLLFIRKLKAERLKKKLIRKFHVPVFINAIDINVKIE